MTGVGGLGSGVGVAGQLPGRFERLSERVNPMLVRVVRQELRNRTFVGVFALLLVGAVISALVVAAFADETGARPDAAGGLFGTLAWAWAFCLWVVQPLGCFRAISTERNDDTWDLVELTGMRPRTVLVGLLLASLVQGVLYTSALAPFMVMAYLLRGLELSSIIFALVVIPAGGVIAAALAVFAAALGNNKPTRAFLGALLGLGLLITWAASAGLWYSIGREIRWLIAALLGGSGEEWFLVGLWANLWIAALVLLLTLAGTLMMFRAANRSTKPRVVWAGLWLNALAWFVAVQWLPGNPELTEILAFFGVFGVVWSGIFGMFAIAEDQELSPRQARWLDDAPRWRRWANPFIGPGAARGRLAWLVMLGASLAIGGLGWAFDTTTTSYSGRLDETDAALRIQVGLAAHQLVWFTIADRLYRGWLRDWFPTPPLRRAFSLLMVAIACVAPLLTFLSGEGPLIKLIAPLSPVQGIAAMVGDDRDEFPLLLPGMLVVGAIAAALQLRQGLQLRVRTQRVEARGNDRNPRGT